jgi:hypothetical protein
MKSLLFMMLVVITASLVGISIIHQYAEGQTPSKRAVGDIVQLTTYAPVAGCIAVISLADNVPNELGVKPGETIFLFSEREGSCVLLGMSKMTKYGPVAFEAQKMTAASLPSVIRADLKIQATSPGLYRLFNVDVS